MAIKRVSKRVLRRERFIRAEDECTREVQSGGELWVSLRSTGSVRLIGSGG